MKKYKAVRYLVMAWLFCAIFCKVLKKTILRMWKRKVESIGTGRMFFRIAAVVLVCSLCAGLIFWQGGRSTGQSQSGIRSSEAFTAGSRNVFQRSSVKTAVLMVQPGQENAASSAAADSESESRKTLASQDTAPAGIPLSGPEGESLKYKTLSFSGEQKAQIVYDLDQIGRPAFPDVSENGQPEESSLEAALSITPLQQDLLCDTEDGQKLNPDYDKDLWGEFQVHNVSTETINHISVSGNDVRSYSWLASTASAVPADQPAAGRKDVSGDDFQKDNDVSSDNISPKQISAESNTEQKNSGNINGGISLKPGEVLVIDLKMPEHQDNDGFAEGILTISAENSQDDTIRYACNTALAQSRKEAYLEAVQDGENLRTELLQKAAILEETQAGESSTAVKESLVSGSKSASSDGTASEANTASVSSTASAGSTASDSSTASSGSSQTQESPVTPAQSQAVTAGKGSDEVTEQVNNVKAQTANRAAAVVLVKADESQSGIQNQSAGTQGQAAGSIVQSSTAQGNVSPVMTWKAKTVTGDTASQSPASDAGAGSDSPAAAQNASSDTGKASGTVESETSGKDSENGSEASEETESAGIESSETETLETETLSAADKLAEIEKQVSEKQTEEINAYLKNQNPQIETVFWKNVSMEGQTFFMKQDSGAQISFYDPNGLLGDNASGVSLLSGYKGEEAADGCSIRNGLGYIDSSKEGSGEYRILLKEKKGGELFSSISVPGMTDVSAPEISREDTGKVMPVPYAFRFDVKDTGGIRNVKVYINGVPYSAEEGPLTEEQAQINGQMAPVAQQYEIPFEEQGQYDIYIEAEDLAGNAAARQMTIKVLPGDLYSVIIPTEFPLHMDLKKLVREHQVESDDLIIKNNSYQDVEVNLRHLNIQVNKDNAGQQEKSAELNFSLCIGRQIIDLGTYAPGSYNNIKSFHLDGLCRENEEGGAQEQAVLKITGSVSDNSEDLWRSGDLTVSAKMDFTGEDVSENNPEGSSVSDNAASK